MIEIVFLAHYTHQIADVILNLSPTSVRWTLHADEMTLVGFTRWDTNVCAERMAASALLGQMLTEHLHLERKDPRVYSREDAVSMGVPLKKRKKETTGGQRGRTHIIIGCIKNMRSATARTWLKLGRRGETMQECGGTLCPLVKKKRRQRRRGWSRTIRQNKRIS